MWYVYYRHIGTGKEEFVAVYDRAEEAIKKIAILYETDKVCRSLGEYYYFMKRH